MGKVIALQSNEKYLKRLATIYLDIYDRDGYEDASGWYGRMTKNNTPLQKALKNKIKEVAPLRGKVIKE